MKKKKFISTLFVVILSPIFFAANTTAYAATPAPEKIIDDTTKALAQVKEASQKEANRQKQQSKQLIDVEKKIQQQQADLQQFTHLIAVGKPVPLSKKKNTPQVLASSTVQTQESLSFEAEKHAKLAQLEQEKAALQQTSTLIIKKQAALKIQQTKLSNKLAQIKKQQTEQAQKVNERVAVVAAAKTHLGKPYVYGATGPDAFDCSGLVQVSFAAIGRSLGRTTVAQETAGTVIPVEQAQAGDLVFWGSHGSTHHVGISTGDGAYIHAPVPGDVVQITTVASYKPDFALRVL
ncbi:peptidoglycan endopeptidase [Erwinia sp. CPCC 100877]|nr:peptidoglycan endopeptidase [Erwinia sp. CPCC 100877]